MICFEQKYSWTRGASRGLWTQRGEMLYLDDVSRSFNVLRCILMMALCILVAYEEDLVGAIFPTVVFQLKRLGFSCIDGVKGYFTQPV